MKSDDLFAEVRQYRSSRKVPPHPIKDQPHIGRAQDQVITISVRAHGFYGEKELRQSFPAGTSRGTFQRPARPASAC